MAQTTTLLAQGAADRNEARFNSPASSRASMYFISPAWPAAIHWGKCCSSENSRTGAIPASSKPASLAACFTHEVIWPVVATAALILAPTAEHVGPVWAVRASRALPGRADEGVCPYVASADRSGFRIRVSTEAVKTERNSAACSSGMAFEIRIIAAP